MRYVPSKHTSRTNILVVPAPSVELLQQGRGAPGLQEEIHLVLFPPAQGLAQHLPGLVQVEVTGPQEPKDVLVFGNLRGQRERALGTGVPDPAGDGQLLTTLAGYPFLMKQGQQWAVGECLTLLTLGGPASPCPPQGANGPFSLLSLNDTPLPCLESLNLLGKM